MDQALNSQKTPHTSPLRASYGMSFVSILMKNDRVIKGFYCKYFEYSSHFLSLLMFRSLVYQLGYICDFVNVPFTSSMSMTLFSKNIPNIFFSYLLTDFF